MMSNPVPDQSSATKLAINKQILELKKKIQLSEGQRKAIFEISEAERKANADEIIRLKKEIGQLVISLSENRSNPLKDHTLTKRIQAIIGPIDQKTISEVKELLDLQIVDKSKQLNLLRFRIKQRQKYLSDLGSEYQTLISEQAKRQVTEKIDNPIKKTSCELQNNIHAVEVQQREAEHVRIRYKDIKKTLQDDAALFESHIKKLDEELHLQSVDIERLEKINREASRMRATARGTLLQEERAALSSAATRERQTIEGKLLVEQCREELEDLEKHMFHVGKTPGKQDAEEQGENEVGGGHAESAEETDEPNPLEALTEMFQLLKQVTGGANTEEVLNKFQSQKSTLARLTLLRQKGEEEKQKLENRKRNLEMELERLKYIETKDTETNIQQLEIMQKETEEENRIKLSCIEETQKINHIINILISACQKQHLAINPQATVGTNPTNVILNIQNEIRPIIDKVSQMKKQESIILETDDEKWFPPPYSTLLTKTPQPQQTNTPAPPPAAGSEDDEEVPSRGFLKRQAQIVVDAKLRRKNIRMTQKRK